jgi:hypothetical protein
MKMNKNKAFSNFNQETFVNGEKVSHKQINIAFNPDDKKNVYAYLKQNNDEFLYKDNLDSFYKKIKKQNNSHTDLISILKSDLESIKTFDKLDKVKFKKLSQLSKKARDKYFKNHQFDNGFIKLNILKRKNKADTKKNKRSETRKRPKPRKKSK